MRSIILAIAASLLLAACDNKEMKYKADAIKEKREKAEAIIVSNDFGTDNLLTAQDYFFSFAEQLEVMKAGPELVKSIQEYANNVSAKDFCSILLLQKSLWESLDRYCRGGDLYSCSTEMESYPRMVRDFMSLFGAEVQQKLSQEPLCQF